MDLHARLDAAIALARAGKNAEALSELVWFHDHALEHDRAFAGVRLSYALSAWKDLATTYPPARDELVRKRDAKAAVLVEGAGNWSTFHDVLAINEYLDEPRATFELFARLHREQPALALDLGTTAWEVVATYGDHELARVYCAEPMAQVSQWSAELNMTAAGVPARFADQREEMNRGLAERYVRRVRLLLDVFSDVTTAERMELVRHTALASVDNAALRDAVRKCLAAQAPRSPRRVQ